MRTSQPRAVVIWDFDGTLAYRTGMWSGTLLEVLQRHAPDCPATLDDLRPYMRAGFPWHTPEHVQPANQPADLWWERMLPVFEQAFRQGAGLSASDAQRLARQVRPTYLNVERWQLFDDVLPCLERLCAQGWVHIVLSNHVPELRELIRALGLEPYLSRVFNSAETGVEKPHPQAFLNVLNTLTDAQPVWMVGDNLRADIAGAQAVGLPAILVRRMEPQVAYCIETLWALPELLATSGRFLNVRDCADQ